MAPRCTPRVPPIPLVGVHDVDPVAVAVARERDPPPSGDQAGSEPLGLARQVPLPAPVGVHDVDLGVAVALPGRRSSPVG